MRHRDETEGCSHHGGRTKTRSAAHPLWPFRHALHRADAVVRLRVDQRSRREDVVHAKLAFAVSYRPKLTFQPFVQPNRQRTLDGLRQVSGLDLRWVNLTARSAGGDQRHSVAVTPGDKRRLQPDAAGRIDNTAKANAKILHHASRGYKVIHHRHLTFRVGETNMLCHHSRFRQPDVAAQGVDLTAGVDDTGIAHIDRGDRPDADPRQYFRRPGADPAGPDHTDVGIGKTP